MNIRDEESCLNFKNTSHRRNCKARFDHHEIVVADFWWDKAIEKF